MRMILNADGFGRDEDTLKAAVECFQAGALSSATIVGSAPATQAAIEYALKHPEFSFGVQVQTLDKGADDARVEDVLRQVAVVRDQGISVSHVAFESALLPPPRVMNRITAQLRKLHVKRARSVPDMYIQKPRMIFGRWIDSMARRRIRSRFITTDRLFVPRSVEDARAMQDWMPPVTDESMEVGVCPGFSDETFSAHRQAIQSFARRAMEAGHHLITWNQL
jgi:hypothetical protein